MITKPQRYLALFAVFGLVYSTNSWADANTCQLAVEQRHFERLSTACINLPHRDRLRKMQLLMSGDFSHYLGTIQQPTQSFALLRQMADAGDHKAQYMYGQLYATVHVTSQSKWENHSSNDRQLTLRQFNDNIRAEAHSWLMKAAEGGHTLAMLEVAESELLRSYTKSDIDLREALLIAKNAKEAKPLLAEDLIKRLRKRIKEYY